MTRLLAALPAVVLLVAAIPAAPVPKERPKEAYYPTTVGTKRVILDGDREYTHVVTAVEEKDGAKIVTVVRHQGGGQPPFELSKVSVSDKGVFVIARGGIELDEPECVLPAGAKKGDSWKSTVDPKWTRTVVGEEEVEVPAGKFRAIRVDSVSTHPTGDPFWSRAWYAPGVGLVKSESRYGSPFALKSFTPGKE